MNYSYDLKAARRELKDAVRRGLPGWAIVYAEEKIANAVHRRPNDYHGARRALSELIEVLHAHRISTPEPAPRRYSPFSRLDQALAHVDRARDAIDPAALAPLNDVGVGNAIHQAAVLTRQAETVLWRGVPK